jgi:hypothetical protein
MNSQYYKIILIWLMFFFLIFKDIIDALDNENPKNNEILTELIDTMKGMDS